MEGGAADFHPFMFKINLTTFFLGETMGWNQLCAEAVHYDSSRNMTLPFKLSDIYDSNLNLLIGSGASSGLFPTLALNVRDETGNSMTVESLATKLSKGREDPSYTALFMHYYKECIEPVLIADYAFTAQDQKKKMVMDNYVALIRTILSVLARKKSGDKRACNIFTTNYDGCIAHAAEELLRSGSTQFFMNDGSLGFKRRYLDARNFTTRLTQTGVFMQHRHDLPQVNLIQLHGSTYWHKDEQRIRIDYVLGNEDRLVKNVPFEKISAFSQALIDNNAKVADLPKVELSTDEIASFWTAYDRLPIVNPTKWKFHETVFEEHYYQMLRYLSYELERSNTTLITFGFSFADEHIRNLIRRSLSNPSLQIFICCFNASGRAAMEKEFATHSNVKAVSLDDNLDFTAFNEKVFTIKPVTLAPLAKESEK